jgi:hypothetical protein
MIAFHNPGRSPLRPRLEVLCALERYELDLILLHHMGYRHGTAAKSALVSL